MWTRLKLPILDTKKVYSVPRRYDLATLFTVSLAFAMLFGLMRALGSHPVVFAVVGGFVTVVGLTQAVLFKGKAPREASILTGAAIFASVASIPMILGVMRGYGVVELLVGYSCQAMCSCLLGAVCGYVVGVLIGGVFLVADAVRKVMRKMKEPPSGLSATKDTARPSAATKTNWDH
jgi:hypothetical protein